MQNRTYVLTSLKTQDISQNGVGGRFQFLRPIYTPNFRAHFRIKLVHLREQKIIVCLVNLQA
jgi:hypothetical protein